MILPNGDGKLIATNTMFIQSRKLASILNYIFNQNCKLAATKRYIVIHFKWTVPIYNSLNQHIISSNRVVNWPKPIQYICIQCHQLAKFVKGLNEYLQPTL